MAAPGFPIYTQNQFGGASAVNTMGNTFAAIGALLPQGGHPTLNQNGITFTAKTAGTPLPATAGTSRRGRSTNSPPRIPPSNRSAGSPTPTRLAGSSTPSAVKQQRVSQQQRY
ncbi:MAG: hypothetical protein R2857_04945 [Vampirovibrionales bacterium]